MTNTFWQTIAEQIDELTRATTSDDVVRILNHGRNPYGPCEYVNPADGFFAGSGGDASVSEALRESGWRTVWAEASYYYVMVAPNGDAITYIEGDIFRGDHRPAAAHATP